MRRLLVVLATVSLVGMIVPAGAAGAGPPEAVIVTLRDNAGEPGAVATRLARLHNFGLRRTYRHALRGFAATLPPGVIAALRNDPAVARVEADGMAFPTADPITQAGATWGLDRIDQRALPGNSSYSYSATGAGVNAYVIDSGINFAHVDFSSRASLGADYVGDGRNGADCNGHGTHVAGTIGGETYGVAKDVGLVSVRIFGCTGGATWSTVIAAVDWVTANHVKPAVVNMSLAGGRNLSAEDAVTRSINAGVSYAVAAGNVGADACSYSPAALPAAMTIGASESNDAKASWSNYGSCIDWFAPGVSIVSADEATTTGTATISGTSMATPHTAGVAALYLDGNPSATPAQVSQTLLNATTQGIVTSSSSTNNHLLYSRLDALDAPPPPPPPPATTTRVADLDRQSTWISDSQWQATVTVRVLNSEGAAVSSATVSGSWSGSGTGSGSCTTGSLGTCTMTRTLASSATSTTYSVSTISHATWAYNAAANGDPDGDSNGTAITVSRPATTTTIRIADLDRQSAWISGTQWRATVTVRVLNSQGAAVSSATVSGSWSGGSSGNSSCLTSSLGTCTLTRTLSSTTTSVTYSVNNVTHATWGYNAAANSDPDTDSNGTSITVFRPSTSLQPATSMRVADLDGKAAWTSSTQWRSTVTIKVLDNKGAAVSGATVTGSWSGGALTGTSSCITSTSGTCSVSKTRPSSGTYMIFTVTNVSRSGLSYNKTANSDPDGDSNGTAIRVNRPSLSLRPAAS